MKIMDMFFFKENNFNDIILIENFFGNILKQNNFLPPLNV